MKLRPQIGYKTVAVIGILAGTCVLFSVGAQAASDQVSSAQVEHHIPLNQPTLPPVTVTKVVKAPPVTKTKVVQAPPVTKVRTRVVTKTVQPTHPAGGFAEDSLPPYLTVWVDRYDADVHPFHLDGHTGCWIAVADTSRIACEDGFRDES
jgi:hypothetical protein